MQRVNSAVAMPQSVYFLVLQWLVEMPQERHFEHIRGWQLGNEAYCYLFLSTAAWSPTRAAMVRVALRLFICSGSRDSLSTDRRLSRLERQWGRALQPVAVLAPADSATARLRRLVRMYRVSAEVMRRLLRLHPELREAAAMIEADVGRLMVEDQSSSSEGSSED